MGQQQYGCERSRNLQDSCGAKVSPRWKHQSTEKERILQAHLVQITSVHLEFISQPSSKSWGWFTKLVVWIITCFLSYFPGETCQRQTRHFGWFSVWCQRIHNWYDSHNGYDHWIGKVWADKRQPCRCWPLCPLTCSGKFRAYFPSSHAQLPGD